MNSRLTFSTFLVFSFFLLLFSLPGIAIAQALPGVVDAGEVLPVPVPDVSVLLQSLGGWLGAGALGIAYAVVNVAMYLVGKTELGNLVGKYKLVLAYALYVATGILGLRMAGVDITAALVHSQTLAAFGTFINQAYKQFLVKKD